MQNCKEADNRPTYIYRNLDYVGPDHRRHSTFKCVDQSQSSNDGNGCHIPSEFTEPGHEAGKSNSDNDCVCKDPHTLSCRPGYQKQPRGQGTQLRSETALNQLIRRKKIPPKILRN